MTEVRIPWTAASSFIGEIAAGHFISTVKTIRHIYRLDLKASKMLADALRDGQFTFQTLDGILDGVLHVVIKIDIRHITFA